jgi:hypothetical protein
MQQPEGMSTARLLYQTMLAYEDAMCQNGLTRVEAFQHTETSRAWLDTYVDATDKSYSDAHQEVLVELDALRELRAAAVAANDTACALMLQYGSVDAYLAACHEGSKAWLHHRRSAYLAYTEAMGRYDVPLGESDRVLGQRHTRHCTRCQTLAATLSPTA